MPDLQTDNVTRRDFNRSALAGLSLGFIGASLSGCGKHPSVAEQMDALPQVEISEILADPSKWEGKEVTVQGDFAFVKDESGMRNKVSADIFGDNVDLMLHVDHRYTLSESGEAPQTLDLIYSREVNLNNRVISFDDAENPRNLTHDYRLRPSTYKVSGVIRMYSNVEKPYLDIHLSMYNSEKDPDTATENS